MVLEPGLLEEGRDVLGSPALGAEDGVAPASRVSVGLGESPEQGPGRLLQAVRARGR
jgi:hypothetical protein